MVGSAGRVISPRLANRPNEQPVPIVRDLKLERIADVHRSSLRQVMQLRIPARMLGRAVLELDAGSEIELQPAQQRLRAPRTARGERDA